MVKLPPHTDLICLALSAERRDALDEAMLDEVRGFGIRNKDVLSWLERWRYDWRTYPFLVAGCSLSENGSAAGGLARDWDAALTLGREAAALFILLSASGTHRRQKAFLYVALTPESRESEFESLVAEAKYGSSGSA